MYLCLGVYSCIYHFQFSVCKGCRHIAMPGRAFRSALQLNSRALSTTKSHPTLQQISAHEMQLHLTYHCVRVVGAGQSQQNPHAQKVMDPKFTLAYC